MEAGESGGEPDRRKRTESSDSELSEGWNIVDQLDVNSQDAPSSDGESVEIIEAEDEIEEHNADVEPQAAGQLVSMPETTAAVRAGQEEAPTEVVEPHAAGQLVSMPETTAAVRAGQEEAPIEVVEPAQEEMFDSSFCWFLLFATSAVLVSNLAFMAAENALDWNMEINVESPSFLRDLPITQKPQPQNTVTWTDSEDVTVDTVDDSGAGEQGSADGTPNDLTGDTMKYTDNSNAMWKKQSLKIDNYEVRKYFKVLSDITGSAEAQNKFAQTLLILDALLIGLKDLEEVVTENSGLHGVLKKQKDTLFDALREVELGVSRSVEKLAISVLNKVQKLERRFENQWCKLEKTGYEEELKGLFYDCQENEEAFEKDLKNTNQFDKIKGGLDFKAKNDEHLNTNFKRDFVHKDNKFLNDKNKRDFNKKNGRYFNGKNDRHKQTVVDSYQYEVDRDSNGKVYSKSSAEDIENDYYKLLKSGKYNGDTYLNEENQNNLNNEVDVQKRIFRDTRSNKAKFYKARHKDPNNGKEKYFKGMNQNYEKTEKERIPRQGKNPSSRNLHRTTDKNPTVEKSRNEAPQSKQDKAFVDKETVEIVTRFLKESCDKSQISDKTTLKNIFHTLKDVINEKERIPSEMFSKMYERYCKFNGKGFKWDKTFKNDQAKGDFAGKVKERELKGASPVIEGHKKYVKHVVEIVLMEESEGKRESEANDMEKNQVILPPNNPRQWTFAYENPSLTNKTVIRGDWFIRSGESRSKTRWSHHRSDWWFDRASHRRSHPHPRRKNWFFRRAWARQLCRDNPGNSWCHSTEEETVTISKTSSNLR